MAITDRPNRNESKHTRRRTLADDLGMGRLNVENMNPNYHYRIENDEGGKIERLKAIGYEVVTHGSEDGTTMGDANAKEVGDAITTTVNKEGVKGILLRQPKEFRDEDVAFQQKQIDDAEKAMFRQKEDGQYGEIKIDKE